jgi:hypothetical protein
VDGADLRDLGEQRLKDLGAPIRLYQLGEGDFPPLKVLYRATLPVQPTPLIGRERELDKTAALLQDARLLTLTGHEAARASGCSSRAAPSCGSQASGSTRSSRCRSTMQCACSPNAHAPSSRTSSPTQRSSRSAGVWTGFRWRSSSPPRGSACSHRASCLDADLETGRDEGRALSLDEAVAFALDD